MAPHAAERSFVAAVAVADVAICFVTLSLVALMLFNSMQVRTAAAAPPSGDLARLAEWPCEDTYVVGEGDALETVGEDCGATTFFVAVGENPHVVVHPEDVAPGLVDVELTPFGIRRW